jgi:hypothetical protein
MSDDNDTTEFRGLDGTTIYVKAHNNHVHDLDVRTKAMLDLLYADLENQRYNEYRAILGVKLFGKCLRFKQYDLANVLGQCIGILMTRPIEFQALPDMNTEKTA